jgi:hypothetical protein
VNLRPLRFEDITIVSQLFAESARGGIPVIGAELPFLQIAERFGVSLRDSRLIEEDGEAIGAVINAVQDHCDDVYTMHWMVRPAWRSRGLGLRVMAQVIGDHARQERWRTYLADVHEGNEATQRMGIWLGFEQVGVLEHWQGTLAGRQAQPCEAVALSRDQFLHVVQVPDDLAHWRRRKGLLARQLVYAQFFQVISAGQTIGGWAVTPGRNADQIETLFWRDPADLSVLLDAVGAQAGGRALCIPDVQANSPLATALRGRGLQVMGRWISFRLELDEIRRRGRVGRLRGSLGSL